MPTNLNQELIEFLNQSPTPFHTVSNMVNILQNNGFQNLQEAEDWPINENQGYFITRNDSSLIAFRLSPAELDKQGCRILGAHTDSPNLKIKPNPVKKVNNYIQLGVEVYGSALLNPWFDRDLSIAGRVSFINDADSLQSCLINFRRAIGTIPSLAIHLDREANSNRSINAQTDLPLILQTEDGDKLEFDLHEILKMQIHLEHAETKVKKILSFDLSCFDTQTAALTGFKNDFISAARLDNLLSCFVCLKALVDGKQQNNTLFVANDHEEVGSASNVGAQGPFLKSVLQRLCGSTDRYYRCVENSAMISADNAHGIHPNYTDKHDDNHGPLLNKGPVIKSNANQRYATNAHTSALFELACERAQVPVQKFAMRSDMACGSTIGPITATEIGVKTVDIGVPTFAMHSLREVAGSQDTGYLHQALMAFLQLDI